MLKSLMRLLSFESSTSKRSSRVGRCWTTEHLELRLLLTDPVVDAPVDPDQTVRRQMLLPKFRGRPMSLRKRRPQNRNPTSNSSGGIHW